MANLIARATGNWLDASTWGVAETGVSAIQATRTASTNTTTSYVYSSAFTVTNADVIEGVLLHCKRVNTTGTVTITLSEDSGVTATREVTVNASDLPADQAWVFFKFGSTLTGDGGADYKVGIKGSSAGNATFYRDGTAGNWARVLRTAATAAPGSGDNLYIAGEWTAAATVAALAVTMNALESSIVDHGTLDIGNNSALTFGAAAATAYYLRLSGDLNVWDGGTLNMGTTGTPMPSDSTAKLNFDCGSNVQFGLTVNNGGTFVAQGASKTVKALLAADAAANATSLTTDVSTSWPDNDVIAVASTTRTNTQCEKGAMNGAAVGTGLTVDGFGGAGGGVAFAHSGTAPTRAEIVNLTRNVQIFGASTTLQSYVLINNTAAVNWDYVEFFWLGSGTGSKRGIDILTTTGSFTAHYCSIHDFIVSGSIGFSITGSAAANITISNCVGFDTQNGFFSIAATTGSATITLEENVGLLSRNGSLYSLSDVGLALANCTAVGAAGAGFQINENATLGTWSGLTSHSNNLYGLFLSFGPASGATISSITFWRNNGFGIQMSSETSGLTLDSGSIFGNATNNISPSANVSHFGLTLKNLTIAGDASFSTAIGLVVVGPMLDLVLESCDFGSTSGIFVGHTTGDISFGPSGTPFTTCYTRNTKLSSTTPIASIDSFAKLGTFVRCQKFGQTTGDHRSFYPHGAINLDSTIFNTASPSERLTPTSTSIKLESGPKRKTVDNGGTATFSVYVRKSVAGDGTAYNGNQPRLVLRKNVAAGIAADTVLATATAAADGAWEQLSGTSGAVTDDAVLEAFVDCDGSQGWINTEDWS